MPRARPPSEPEEDEEIGEDEAAPETPSRHRKPPAHLKPHPRGRRGAKDLKAWDDPDTRPGEEGDEDDGADDGDAEEEEEPAKERVYFRARDAWWFEALVALAIIAVLLASLFAFTQNWPPIYVVESMSMQHGDADQLGLINTGDLVLAQHIDPANVQPYIPSVSSGYTTYGEYGDVVLYHPNGDTSQAPIIHRALVYVDYNPDRTYSIPSLNGLPCGSAPNAVYNVSNTASGCGALEIPRGSDLALYNVGWRSVEVDVPMDPSILGSHSGFLTMGDNNFDSGNGSIGVNDQVGDLSQLVEGGWVIGVARGMIPWFGALKLALSGNASEVPPQSWQYMGLTIVVVFIAALSLHLFLRREGYEDERRREQEEEEEEQAEKERPPKQKGPPARGLHLWRDDAGEAEDEEEAEVPSHRRSFFSRRQEPKGGTGSSARGRPVPKVGRRSTHSDEDEEL